FQVAAQFFPGQMQHTDLDGGAVRDLLDQIVQAAPGSFQLLEVRMVEDCVNLATDELIDLGYGLRQEPHGAAARQGPLPSSHADEPTGQVPYGARRACMAVYQGIQRRQTRWRVPQHAVEQVACREG